MQDLFRRSIGNVVVWMFACFFCTLTMIYFYDLLGPGILYPFKDHNEQIVAVLRTAFSSTLAASWAIWFGTKGINAAAAVFLRTALPMQFSLTLYAIAGWQSPPSLDLIFPSTFFSEYNWLTFIFEIAPAVAIATGFFAALSAKLTAIPDIDN